MRGRQGMHEGMVKLFGSRRAIAPPHDNWSVGDRRVYAVGDIHGRRDLFELLLRRIEADAAARGDRETHLILLGDLIDRGPDSRGVVDLAMKIGGRGTVRMLKGNHEEVFVRAARGDILATGFLMRFGGRETLLSYGLEPDDYDAMNFEQLAEWMLANIPREHVDFLDGFEDMIEMDDYLFVHAGIRPDVALDEQNPSDLRWIRNEFLYSRAETERLVIHGHSVTEAIDEWPHRIGIDTGAFASNRLTAIGLDGTDRWYLSTIDD